MQTIFNKHKMLPCHATPCNDGLWSGMSVCWLCYSILHAHFAVAMRRHMTFGSDWGIYNKIFSLSSIAWNFRVDFVCKNGRKAFQYAF